MSSIDQILHPKVRTISKSAQPKKVWLTTFTDMIALMLTFFVMTYAMSEPRQEEFDKMRYEVQAGASKFEGPPFEAGELDTITLSRLNVEQSLDLDYLQALFEDRLSQIDVFEDIIISRDRGNQQLVLSLPTRLGFKAGSSELTEDGQLFIARLAPVLSRIDNSIEITGHADASPLSQTNKLYASNWDLSLQRALSVAQELEKGGYGRNMIVTGQAHTQQSLLPETMTLEQRKDLSRRVDILINKETYSAGKKD